LIGEPCTPNLINLLVNHITDTCNIWNLYGPTETIICTFHHVNPITNTKTIPIGLLMPNYKCKILNEFLQCVAIGKDGELFIGGIGVFAGYLERDDLTAKVLFNIDGELLYQTGDLVRMDDKGLLHYRGRKDHQIKLRGQRIELGEIEHCLLKTSISACVVMKWNDDHLIAYVESSCIDDKQLREHCESHLPPHMIPSKFIILEQMPLNSNGKVDRKRLPSPHSFNLVSASHNEVIPLSSLEMHLCRIFKKAFRYESLDVNMSFGKIGGTSLDAIRALWLIRQEICSKIDATILFANPSIRQLARAIKPLLVVQDDLSVTPAIFQFQEELKRPMPSLCIEIFGIILLVCQWLFPIWVAYHSNYVLTFVLIPVFHLLSYVVCQRLLFYSGKIETKVDRLYSWHYYRWWFLNSMWSNNNSYWLQHLIGTSFYNFYLRLCGAKIGYYSHIYTTLIDAPWLIELGQSTFIGEEVVLSSLSYQDQTYKLHPIQIGSYCSINTRCVLYDGVTLQDHSYIEAMSSITGHPTLVIDHINTKDRSLSLSQIVYQFTCLLCLLFTHSILLFFAYLVYCCCSSFLLPLSIRLALVWCIWVFTNLFIALLLLKYLVGSVTSGRYPLNSYHFLHKIWLRQLIITSFHHSLDLVPSYDVLASIIIRWLGANIEDDVKFAEFRQMLSFPSDLLNIECGVTTFGGAKLAPFEITREGFSYIDKIHLGFGANLGNWCTLMPGTRISPKTIVGSFTYVTRETVSRYNNGVLLGIPAHEMPFSVPDNISIINDLSSSPNSLTLCTLLMTCISLFLSKCIMISLYSLLPFTVSLSLHIILFCTVHRCLFLFTEKRTQSEVSACIQEFFHILTIDFSVFVGPYLSGTQFLVFLFRVLGAQIGSDVILSDINCLTDSHLVTIGNHVRLNTYAYIQVR
jgi:acetyltransferase-like isoleucine patch superfamily enzyme